MNLIATALDPRRSVVVEACAGSGKTWLLASRIVRLLLAGVAPGEILAITFTRKAAREIEERVLDWLRLLATAEEAEALDFLRQRYALSDEAVADAAVLRRARGLYESVSAGGVSGNEAPLAVHTFHGWFLQLLAAAPLESVHAGASLTDSVSKMHEEVWQALAAALQAAPDSAAAVALRELFDSIGQGATQQLVRAMVERRAEWAAFTGHVGSGEAALAYALEALAEDLGVPPGSSEAEIVADCFRPGWEADWQAYLGLLEMRKAETSQRKAAELRQALAADDAAARLEALAGVVLTQKGTPTALKYGPTLVKELQGEAAAEKFVSLHGELAGRVQAALAARQEWRVFVLNRAGLSLGHAYLQQLDAWKQARRLMDFADAEWRALDLLQHEEHAALTQARLDARYRHLLLDEFQDTNPLQWHILLAWLEAYSSADEAPRVFLVGDPKQSIYRFRRAEPRLFEEAANYLCERLAAVRLSQDATRRNAPAIVDVINQLFGNAPIFTPFRPQSSLAGDALPGRVEILSPCVVAEEEEAESGGSAEAGWRNPLTTPPVTAEAGARRQEALTLASRIQDMVGSWQIDHGGRSRALRYGDIMLLVRTRTQLAEYEQALREAGIPYLAASRGGLLRTPEASDIGALLRFLVLPADNLALAQTLRSPLCSCSNEDLLALSGRVDRRLGQDWWGQLTAWMQEDLPPPPSLHRAWTLLEGWRQVADRLPAHDLLDRIYSQGDLRARYAAAVPPAMRPAVAANLTAILDLALDLDGGRYPSLPRFLAELDHLATADGDEAPDEGLIDGEEAEDAGRVRILTIHAAKGLEAPVVWLLDAHSGTTAKDAWSVLVEWPPGAAHPSHFSLLGKKDERGEKRAPLFEQEAAAAAREELNLLYVAITRARQVFIASGVQPRKNPGDTFLSRLARAVGQLNRDEAAAEEDEAAVVGGEYGQVLPLVTTAAEQSASEPGVESELGTRGCVPPPPAVGSYREASSGGARFGTLLHAALEALAQDLPLPPASTPEAHRANDAARHLLTVPEVRPFFDPVQVRQAWNELEIAEADGHVRRADRVVLFDDAVWVLDYKSGDPEPELLADYHRQVAAYRRLLTPMFAPRPVRGALIFADGRVVEVGNV